MRIVYPILTLCVLLTMPSALSVGFFMISAVQSFRSIKKASATPGAVCIFVTTKLTLRARNTQEYTNKNIKWCNLWGGGRGAGGPSLVPSAQNSDPWRNKSVRACKERVSRALLALKILVPTKFYIAGNKCVFKSFLKNVWCEMVVRSRCWELCWRKLYHQQNSELLILQE